VGTKYGIEPTKSHKMIIFNAGIDFVLGAGILVQFMGARN
jgi:hypothetical protein